MIRIIKNFYDDPDEMVEKARSSRYQLISNGNYPGKDGLDRMFATPELERKLELVFPSDRYKIVCSRFRYALENDTYMSYVHADSDGRCRGWHVLIYLTKNSPVKDGLALYEAKTTGQRYWKDDEEEHNWDFPNWKPWQEVEYEYNQAVIVDYSYFHAPIIRGGFGNSIENSRILHIIEVVDIQRSTDKYGCLVKSIGVTEHHHPYSRENHHKTLLGSDAETTSYERIEYLEN
jgi:hypothetical protein